MEIISTVVIGLHFPCKVHAVSFERWSDGGDTLKWICTSNDAHFFLSFFLHYWVCSSFYLFVFFFLVFSFCFCTLCWPLAGIVDIFFIFYLFLYTLKGLWFCISNTGTGSHQVLSFRGKVGMSLTSLHWVIFFYIIIMIFFLK